jgi:N-acetylglutamate synthase-like GNAT family acetyltransferase
MARVKVDPVTLKQTFLDHIPITRKGITMCDTNSQTMSAHVQTNNRLPSVTNTVFLKTRTGFEFSVRPVEPFDEPALAHLFAHVGADDMRFRFLSSMKAPGHEILKKMIDVDHHRKEDYLAIAPDGETVIASAVVAADATNENAEVAIAMHQDYKHKGVGWTFLDYVIGQEKRKGVQKLRSIESRDNHEAIALERQTGFTATRYPGDATLVMLEFDLTNGTR